MERETGVSQVTILHIEQGRRRPHISTIKKLSAYLGIEPRSVTEFSAAMDDIIVADRRS
jgi:transcriptional regulator with XRE-family HTH domain